ncbi:MAG TPA: hypothetical protein VFM98_07905 [Ramlibacter sp.]|uniref:hypothetical protein n=1 Tax=Ramlibacter sp. TaxID=1917967 RepID=UPI002D7E5821|nr:hypothetical protein [Ramlibacter sp.]HET8745513.1 hypothetical protein [Ramlibacter sp.]
MKRLLLLMAVVLLAACTSMSKVQGEQVVGERLVVNVPGGWNRVLDRAEKPPYEVWTQEGIPLDHLRLWAGIHPGQPLLTKWATYSRAEDAKPPRVPSFRAGLTPEKLVRLFEEVYATAGTVAITKVEPTVFAGQKGVRFEFALARRSDDLNLRGVVWVAVRPDPVWGEELYAASFVAPKLSFYERLLPMAEEVVKSARVRSSAAGA